MSTLLSASWKPEWYNLDQSMAVGRRHPFAFAPPGLEAVAEQELVFAATTQPPSTFWVATVVAIEHARFGPVDEVDTRPFGEYLFRFGDGRWVAIETEEGLGRVNSASPDFPAGECDEEWAYTGGWALHVTLTDVEGPVSRQVARALMHRP